MMDCFLPRLVAGGLLTLAVAGMFISAFLKLHNVDASDILTASSTATGALAGFFAGSKFNTTEIRPVVAPNTQGIVTQDGI